MINAYKDIIFLSIVLFIINSVYLLGFSDLYFGLILVLLFILLVCLFIISLFIYVLRSFLISKKIGEADISAFHYIDTLLKKSNSLFCKSYLYSEKIIFYLYLNKLEEANILLEKYMNSYNPKDYSDEATYIYFCFLIAIKNGNVDVASNLINKYKNNIRCHYMSVFAIKSYINSYTLMKYMLIVEKSNSKIKLMEAETFFADNIENKSLIMHVLYFENLIKIYKKIGNVEEEKKCRDSILNIVGEHYLFLD